MYKNIKKLIVGLLFGVLLVIPLTRVSAEVVWEDNFDDGDLDGWVLKTYYTTDIEKVPLVKGEVKIKNENNRMLLPSVVNSTHYGMNTAGRTSTQVYGHWSYDVDTTSGSDGDFMFIHRDPTPETDREGWTIGKPIGFEGYTVAISTLDVFSSYLLPGIYLFKMNVNFTNVEGLYASSVEDILLDSIKFTDLGFGFKEKIHIDITRKLDGNITVYANSTKVLNAIDNEYTISDVVSIASFDFDAYYDNIRVDSDYNFVPKPATTTTPTTTTIPSWNALLLLLSLFVMLSWRQWKKKS
jgi:hypothetical protein